LEQFPSGRPIFITGSHRSGTTWIAAMLAVPGVWYLHEPFNPNKGMWHEIFSYASKDAPRSDVDDMMDRICKGRVRQALRVPRASSPVMPLRWLPVHYKRMILKDPHACLMANYLTDRLGSQTLAIFRHPAGFVRSVVDLGWTSSIALQEFLRCPDLMQSFFSGQTGMIEKYSTREGMESDAVLHACLCKVLWEYSAANSNILAVKFEDLAMDPIQQFKHLFEKLGLPYTESVHQLHVHLTQSEGNTSNQGPHSVHRKSADMAWKWKGTFSPSELGRIRDLWREFDIPLYNDETEWAG
jgi:hypothetical protein